MSDPRCYRLDGVSKQYAGRTVLQVARLDVLRGEVLCLVGPTGCGKSTLLRLLAALEPPSGGELSFAEHRLAGRPLPLAVQRRLVMVFQRPLLLTGTVRDNVEYGLRLRGVVRDPPRVGELLEGLHLADVASQPARTLSVGQAQLVALARALVLEPDVLLLDEPTANLDPAHVALVEEAVGRARGGRAMTVVWATHNLFQARRVADRVALLLGGRLVEAAPAPAFFEAPADARTLAFVQGKMVY